MKGMEFESDCKELFKSCKELSTHSNISVKNGQKIGQIHELRIEQNMKKCKINMAWTYHKILSSVKGMKFRYNTDEY